MWRVGLMMFPTQLFLTLLKVERGQTVQGSAASGSIDDRELEEDCIASEANINITCQPMPSVLQTERIENDIYSCAPGENNTLYASLHVDGQ